LLNSGITVPFGGMSGSRAHVREQVNYELGLETKLESEGVY